MSQRGRKRPRASRRGLETTVVTLNAVRTSSGHSYFCDTVYVACNISPHNMGATQNLNCSFPDTQKLRVHGKPRRRRMVAGSIPDGVIGIFR